MSAGRPSCAGAILAGGRSERMGGGHKALSALAGRPMIDHVIARLRGQAEPLLVSVESAGEDFARLAHTLVEDRVPSHRGPLTGLYSALQYLVDRLDAPWLLLCPCDAPFLPADLADQLLGAATGGGVGMAVAAYDGHLQPTFSAWHRDLLPEVRSRALEKTSFGVIDLVKSVPHARVEWPQQEPPPFFNVNTPEQLAQAEAWLAHGEEG